MVDMYTWREPVKSATLDMNGSVLTANAICIAVGLGMALGQKPRIRNFCNPRYTEIELQHLENRYEWFGI